MNQKFSPYLHHLLFTFFCCSLFKSGASRARRDLPVHRDLREARAAALHMFGSAHLRSTRWPEVIRAPTCTSSTAVRLLQM